jgi:hypothetical protein
MRPVFFTLILSVVLLCTGCTEEQMKQIDLAIADANNIAVAAAPVSAAVPAPWGLYLLLASNIITTGAAIWEKFRLGTVQTKYQAMKTGQAQFTLENPESGKKLFEIVGVERVSAGVQ